MGINFCVEQSVTPLENDKKVYSFGSMNLYLPLPCSAADTIKFNSFILFNILPAEDGAKPHVLMTSARVNAMSNSKRSNRDMIFVLVGVFSFNSEMERSNVSK